MTISKAHWNSDGDSVRLSLPFAKVDKERRTVSGFASLDNVDKQGDIVTAEASMKAFSEFRGNIREMHQPSAVGKMVSFKQDRYFDPETKKFYNGVFVSAYISKGANDAWEKVLDGTYTGFSIGGKMNKWDDGYDEKSDSTIRIIKDYDLVELSLVDSPANQFANIMHVEKVDGVSVVKGADVALENVFYDEESGLVMVSDEESVKSPTTGNPMKNIGFVEKEDNEKIDMVKFLVDSAKGINTSKRNKEEDPMSRKVKAADVEKTDAVVEDMVAPEADAVVEAPAVEEVADAPVEAPVAEEVAEKSEELPVTEEVVEKSEEIATTEAVVEETAEVSKSDEVIAESVNAVSDSVTEIKNTLTSAFSDLVATVKSLQDEVASLTKSLDSVRSEVSNTQGAVNEFGKRVDAVEADTAFRKSGDLGEIVQYEPEMVQKSLWGGRFLKTADLFK
jgi:Putative phage serine protease XkdF